MRPALPAPSSAITSASQYELVENSLFPRMLKVFMIFGIPAMMLGIIQLVLGGYPLFALMVGFLGVLGLLDLHYARRLAFEVAAGFQILVLFMISMGFLWVRGLTGSGIIFAAMSCALCVSFFDLRKTTILIGVYVGLFAFVGAGMVLGVIPVPRTIANDSRSFLSWLGAILDFLLFTAALVVVQGEMRGRIERDFDRFEAVGRKLADANRLLSAENANRRAAEEALRRSEESYRLIVENAHDAIFIGQDGMAKFPNRKALELLGYCREEVAGISLAHFVHPEDRARVMDNYVRRIGGESVPTEYSLRLRTKSGETVWVSLSAVSFTWEGRPANLYFARDVTALKKLEDGSQRGQKLEVVGMLTGGIAHDFNNLLQVIQGYGELVLQDLPPGSPARQELQEIQRASSQGTDLARQLLSFSRKMQSTLQPVSLNDCVRRVELLLRRVLPRMIDVEIRLDHQARNVMADAGQLDQVLLNLAINARDAMPRGGTLTLETSAAVLDEDACRAFPDLRPGTYARLRVIDTGEGIPAEVLPRIFEPFYTTKDEGKGTGLGLAMVYGIVRNHHGTVSCQSSPGAGASFTIHLPAIVEEPTAPAPAEQPAAPGGTETILVVDDEDAVRALLERVLREAGYSVLVAADAARALELYRAGGDCVDLVLMDLIMPGRGGHWCIEEILRLDPRARVVVMSGGVPDGTGPGIDGVRGCILKPFQIRSMLSAVRRFLDEASGPSPAAGASAESSAESA
jgi:two-component system, cell cycle sensor histidine kinase and response regulator CckA